MGTPVGIARLDETRLSWVFKETTLLGVGQFGDCASLASITIPRHVRSLGEWAFNGCGKLTGVCFLGDAPASDSSAFDATRTTLYYLPGARRWGATLSGRPAALCDPLILAGASLGARARGDSASTSPARATWWSWWSSAATSRGRRGARYGPTSSAGPRPTSWTSNGRATTRASTASAGRDLGAGRGSRSAVVTDACGSPSSRMQSGWTLAWGYISRHQPEMAVLATHFRLHGFVARSTLRGGRRQKGIRQPRTGQSRMALS